MRHPFRATLALSLLTLLALSAPAAAAPNTTKTVGAKIVFEHGANPEDPGNCSAVVFVQWKHEPNTLSATALWTFQSGRKGEETMEPPYDDHYDWVREYNAPAGTHRIEIGTTWQDGWQPNDCSHFNENHKMIYGREAQVKLTIENVGKTEECAEALKNLRERNRRVRRLRGKIEDASRSEKPALREKLATAKDKRARAAARVRRQC